MSQQPLLQAIALSRYYKISRGSFQQPATVKALNHVSFKLYPKQTLAIVGESGSGKSTLARVIVKAEGPSSGKLILKGKDITKAKGTSLREAQRQIRMIFQNPYASLNPRWRIFHTLEQPLLLNTDLNKEQRREKIYNIMKKVGLREEYAKRYPHMFSGGQRQRIAIARALILEPDIIVADEAVSALDVSIQAQILNLMQDLQDELNLSYLFISHDLGVVRHTADQVLVMYFGFAVEYGPSEKIFQHPRHPYTKGLLSSTPHLHPENRTDKPMILKGELPSPLNPPSGCKFHTRCPFATETCRKIEPELREFDGRQVACHHAEEV